MRELAQIFYDLDLDKYAFERIFAWKFDRWPTKEERKEFFEQYESIEDENSSYESDDSSYSY